MPIDKECVNLSPIGLIPKFVWDYKRVGAILEAMERFSEANKHIPGEWIKELRDLIGSETLRENEYE